MTRFFDDPWLSLARRLIAAAYALVAALTVLVALLAVAMLAMTITGYHSPYAAPTRIPEQVQNGFCFGAVPMLAVYAWFLRLLRQIVDTVAQGDPFVRVNAERLTRMTWLTLALFVAAAIWNDLLPDAVAASYRFPSPGLLLPATLFILARVFRQGAAMRQDLEGTI